MTHLMDKLYPYFEKLSYDNAILAQRAIGCLILLDNVKLFDEMVNLFDETNDSKEFLKPVKALVQEIATTKDIWRTVLLSIKENSPIEETAKLFNVDPSDAHFCYEGLHPKEKLQVQELVKENFLLKPLSEKDNLKIIKSINSYCNMLTYKKLRFIASADHSMVPEDLKNELITKALKMIRHYDHLSDDGITHNLTKIENYVKQGLSNYVTNFINYHTTQKRSRIENITEYCGTCDHCLTGNSVKCRHAVQDFQQTTLSFDLPHLHDRRGYKLSYDNNDQKNAEDILEHLELIQVLKKNSNESINIYLDIITESHIPESFENWVEAKYKVEFRNLQDHRKINNYALEYLNLDKQKTKRILQNKYERYVNG